MSTVRSVTNLILSTGGGELILYHLPPTPRLYVLEGGFNLSTPATVTVTAHWQDGAGPQEHVFATGPQPTGTYPLPPLALATIGGSPIQLHAACDVPNVCRLSAALQVL